MISERPKGMRFIWELHDRLYDANHRSKYKTVLAQVTKRCAELNAEVTRLDKLHSK